MSDDFSAPDEDTLQQAQETPVAPPADEPDPLAQAQTAPAAPPGAATIPAAAAATVPALQAHPGYVAHDPDEVPAVDIAHDGDKYVAPPRGKPVDFDEPAPDASKLREFQEITAQAARLPPKERVAVLAALKPLVETHKKELSGYDARKKAYEGSEQRRLDKEAGEAKKELLKSMGHYDQKHGDMSHIETQVHAAHDAATKEAEAGPDVPADADEKTRTAAVAANKEKFAASLYGDKQVDQAKVRQMVTSLMTSNPNMTAERAMRIVDQLATIDPADATKRAYKAVGRDITEGKNVVLAPAKDGPHRFQPVHMRPAAYDDLKDIVRGRLQRAATRGKAAALTAAEEAGASTSNRSQDLISNRVVAPAKKIGAELADKATTIQRPTTPGSLREDVRRVGDALRRGAVAIGGGPANRTMQSIMNYPSPYRGALDLSK